MYIYMYIYIYIYIHVCLKCIIQLKYKINNVCYYYYYYPTILQILISIT